MLRQARSAAGLSQRALAERADVSRRVIETAESGQQAPRSDVLEQLLRACGMELTTCPSRAPTTQAQEQEVRQHLHLSLTRRIALSVGGPAQHRIFSAGSPLWQSLCRLAGSCGRVAAVEGPLALAAWVPGVTVARGQRLTVPTYRMGALSPRGAFDIDVEEGPWPEHLVRVRLPHRGRYGGELWVPPPALVDDTCPRTAVLLSVAADLLHAEGARDAADRRRPAHERPNENLRTSRTNERYDGSRRTAPLPSVLDSQQWRLGVAGSVEQDALRRGLVRHEPKPGWSRWGWR